MRDPATWYTEHHHKAACLGVDQELFFGEGRGQNYSIAKKICDSCPVKTECAWHFLDETIGYVGGMTPKQRRAIRMKRAA